MAIRLPRLPDRIEIVDNARLASVAFIRWWQEVVQSVEDALNGVVAALTAAGLAQEAAEGAQSAADEAKARADQAQADAAQAQADAIQAIANAAAAQTTADAAAIDATAANTNANSRVPQSRLIATGTGLQGGGDMTADRSLSIDSTVVTLTGTQTLTNKTLTAPTINGGTLAGGTSIPNGVVQANGRVLVNTTSAIQSSAARLQVYSNQDDQAVIFQQVGAGQSALALYNSADAGDNVLMNIYTDSAIALRGSITFNRAGGLVAYNTTSDYRAKWRLGYDYDAGALFDAIPVRRGRMRGATLSRPMFLAHEVAEGGAEWAVHGEKDARDKYGKPVLQQLNEPGLIPAMWAEIRALRKRVAALEK